MTSGIQNHSGFATDHVKNDECSFGNPVNAVIPVHIVTALPTFTGVISLSKVSLWYFRVTVCVSVMIFSEFRYKYAFPPLGCEGSKEMGISRKSLVRGLKILREKASQR